MRIFIYFFIILFPTLIFSQVGIGTTTPDTSAALEIQSTDSGILIPRLTQVQRDAITTPATGVLIFQTDNTPGFYYYNGTAWVTFSGGSVDNDWTVNTNDIYNSNTGNVGIGTNAPTTKLHIDTSAGFVPPIPGLLDVDFESGNASPLNLAGSGALVVDVNNQIPNMGNFALSTFFDGFSGLFVSEVVNVTTDPIDIPAGGETLRFFVNLNPIASAQIGPNEARLLLRVNGVNVQNVTGSTGGYIEVTEVIPAGVGTVIQFRFQARENDNFEFAIDDITLGNTALGNITPALRIQDGSEALGRVLTSDANGNATWQDSQTNNASNPATNAPSMLTVYGMAIPACNTVSVGSTGVFNVDVQGTNTSVSWEVLDRKDTTGQTATVAGQDVLVAPFQPSQLQVRFDFSPSLPFNPDGIFFSGNNSITPFIPSSDLNTFRFNYVSKSDSSITMNIGRTDRFGDTSASCWAGSFHFDMLMTQN